jgi:hypothetical protein
MEASGAALIGNALDPNWNTSELDATPDVVLIASVGDKTLATSMVAIPRHQHVNAFILVERHNTVRR